MTRRCLRTIVLAAALGVSFAAGARAAAGGTYLIVHPGHLAAAAEQWARYRRADGWQTITCQIAPGDDAAAVRRNLWERLPAAGPRAVLILGDADAGGVPTWRFEQADPTLRAPGDRHYVSDHPYQVRDDSSNRPEIMLGRIPARTAPEAEIVLDKVRRYERNEAPGQWRRRVAYTAAEGHFGFADRLLELMFQTMIGRLVPDAFDISMTYAKASSVYCPPPSQLTDTVLAQLGDGALLFNYIGHGSAGGFDRLHWNGRQLPILDVRDLQRLPRGHARLPIALLTCCSAGWYDLPHGAPSIGEAMLFHPSGPVAVIAGSRPTHPYANVILQKDVTRLLLVDRVKTVGELDLRATQSMLDIDRTDRELDALATPMALIGKWPSTLGALRRMHVRLYNLLGDPALRIAMPRGDMTGLELAGNRLTGEVHGMVEGVVTITIETDRGSPARSHELLPVFGTADPDLEAKAAHNYPIANDVVLSAVDGAVAGGRFEIALAGGLPARAAVIKAYARGWDEDGGMIDAIGALRLKRRDPSPPAGSPDRLR